MSCFSHFIVFFGWWWWRRRGGAHGFLPTIVGYAMRGGGQEKNTPNNRGASKNCKGKIENHHNPPST